MTDDKTAHGSELRLSAAARHKAWDDLFPMTVKEIKYEEQSVPIEAGWSGKAGSFVSIKPVDDDKTYLGLYIGDAAAGYRCSYDKATKTLTVGRSMSNPAIWVFDLNRVVMGYESWWGEIESEADLKEITASDINNVWYVRALKALAADRVGEEVEAE